MPQIKRKRIVSGCALFEHGYHDAMWNQSRRLADLVIAAALLIFASPLIGFVTLAIRWEGPGPIFERQTCIARGRRFQMLNFRTTVPDPEHKIPVWTRSPTPVGEVLRYTLSSACRSLSMWFEATSLLPSSPEARHRFWIRCLVPAFAGSGRG